MEVGPSSLVYELESEGIELSEKAKEALNYGVYELTVELKIDTETGDIKLMEARI